MRGCTKTRLKRPSSSPPKTSKKQKNEVMEQNAFVPLAQFKELKDRFAILEQLVKDFIPDISAKVDLIIKSNGAVDCQSLMTGTSTTSPSGDVKPSYASIVIGGAVSRSQAVVDMIEKKKFAVIEKLQDSKDDLQTDKDKLFINKLCKTINIPPPISSFRIRSKGPSRPLKVEFSEENHRNSFIRNFIKTMKTDEFAVDNVNRPRARRDLTLDELKLLKTNRKFAYDENNKMSSLTRAVTSRINEFTSGRQRLTTEKEHLPTPTSEFNYIIPPEIIWEDYQAQHKEPLQIEIVEPEQTVVAHQKKSSPANFSQKVTAVVRKLSPFTDDSSSPKSTSTNGDDVKKPDEKNLKTKNGKKKKTKKSKDREQLIDSSDDEF